MIDFKVHGTFWNLLKYNNNILNSCPTQGRVEGWDAMKPLYYRSVSSKGAGRPRLTHHQKGRWNETKWMRWVWRNGGMKFVVGENGRSPKKNLPRPRFVHHETHMEWPRRELGTPAVEGERLTACATRPPQFAVQKYRFSRIITTKVLLKTIQMFDRLPGKQTKAPSIGL